MVQETMMLLQILIDSVLAIPGQVIESSSFFKSKSQINKTKYFFFFLQQKITSTLAVIMYLNLKLEPRHFD